jgi:methyl-accepting chemotaxis protein
MNAKLEPRIERRRRRRGQGAFQRALFRRILIAEVVVVAATMAFSFLLAHLFFSALGSGGAPGRGILLGVVSALALAALVALLAAVRVSRGITAPMNKIRDALKLVGRGRAPDRVAVRRDDDLRELVDGLNDAVEEIRRRRREVATSAPPIGADVLSMLKSKPERSESEPIGGKR